MPADDGRRHPLALRTFTIPTSPSTNITVRITEPSLIADNLPLETWASSTILASQLHSHPITFPTPSSSLPSRPLSHNNSSVPILELGAGTGLVGLVAAHVYDQRVVLTDLPPIVPGLEANIALNVDTDVLKGKAGIRAGVLDWTAPDELILPPPPPNQDSVDRNGYDDGGGGKTITLSVQRDAARAHVLLAADTLYSEEHPALLTDVVGKWLSKNPAAKLVLGTALRVAYLDELRELWARLEALGLECEDEGKGMAEAEDFDDERLVEWSFWRWKQ